MVVKQEWQVYEFVKITRTMFLPLSNVTSTRWLIRKGYIKKFQVNFMKTCVIIEHDKMHIFCQIVL
jgi:hypothetical protein